MMMTTKPKTAPLETDPYSDFRNFLYDVWKFLGLPDPTWMQYDIAAYLQHGPKRAIVEALRGEGKSWITSTFVCWLLLRNPQVKILVVSASKDRADQFSIFTKQLIETMPCLMHLRPKNHQRSSNKAFDVAPATPDHAPSVKSVGITGQLSGSRADYIIADDVEVPNNSSTQTMRELISELVKEFDAILKKKMDTGDMSLIDKRIIYLGTPQTEQSLYNRLLSRGYMMRIWTARYPTEKKLVNYGNRLAPEILKRLGANPHLNDARWGLGGDMGEPTDPGMFGEEELIERELSWATSGFALQYMLDTRLSDSEKYPLKLSDLIMAHVNPTDGAEKLVWASDKDHALGTEYNVGFDGDHFYVPMRIQGDYVPYTGTVMSIDPSGRGKDETSYCVLHMLYGRMFLPHGGWGGFRAGYDDTTLTALAEIAKKHQVNCVYIEDNYGDGMFEALFKPVLMKERPCKIETVTVTGQKEKRIVDTLEPVMNQHRLVVDPRVIEEDFKSAVYKQDSIETHNLRRGFFQMTRMTKERQCVKHDDRVDALHLAVRYWTEKLSQDDEKMTSRRKEKDHAAYIKDWAERPNLRGFAGHRPQKKNRSFEDKI